MIDQVVAITTDFSHWIGPVIGLQSVAILLLVGLLVHSLDSHYRIKRLKRDAEEMIARLSEGVYRSSLDGKQLYANAALVKLNGYDSLEEMLQNVNDIATEWYVDPQRRSQFRYLIETQGEVRDFVSEIYRHKTRERIWISENARLVRDSHGNPLYCEGTVTEVTERVLREERDDRERKLLAHVPGGLFHLVREANGNFHAPFLSSGFKELYGLPEDVRLEDLSLYLDRIHPDDRDRYNEAIRQSRLTGKDLQVEFRIVTDDNRTKWLSIAASVEREDGKTIWYGYCNDVTAQKDYAARVEALAYIDPLTSLPNRRMIMHRIGQTVASCARRVEFAAALLLDIDDFKAVNAHLGHEASDEILRGFAEAVADVLRRNDTIGRLGGDNFMVIIDDLGSVRETAYAKAITVAKKIENQLSRGIRIDGVSHLVTVSIGINIFDGAAQDANEIVKHAETARDEAKTAGRNTYTVFDPVTMDRSSDRYVLLRELRGALERGEIEIHLQPQTTVEGKVTGAEALARWRHPRFGMVYPDQFIPLAEQFGLINQMGDNVLAQGLECLSDWAKQPALSGLSLSINVCISSMMTDDFADRVIALVKRYQIEPSRLTLEITETVLAKNKRQVSEQMSKLRELGIRFSLDDFGTGYASLSYLSHLPLDEVKIDGSFIQDVDTNENRQAIVRTILSMARNMGLKAVAEHVETQRQVSFLAGHGCRCFQGYLFGKPMKPDAFANFIKRKLHVPEKQSA